MRRILTSRPARLKKSLLVGSAVLGLLVVPLTTAATAQAPTYSTTLTNASCTLTATFTWTDYATTNGSSTARVILSYLYGKGKDASYGTVATKSAAITTASGSVTTSYTFSGGKHAKYQAIGDINTGSTANVEVVKGFRCGAP